MALKKNKIHILEKLTNISKDIELSGCLYDDFDYYYEYQDWEEDYYDDYDYLENSCMIDMNSFYPKDVIRQKRINQILGIESTPKIPTFADIVEFYL